MKQEFHLNIEKALTASRLSAYKNNDENYEETLARYLYNIELCRALYSSLHFFEICLRNKIDEILSQFCNRNDWYTIIPHERICHWNDLQSKHDLILECIKWMQPSVFELVTKVDTFEHIYNHGEMQFLPIIKDNWN